MRCDVITKYVSALSLGLHSASIVDHTVYRPAHSHGFTVSPMTNLTGSPLHRVNIYSNGASDADFLPQRMKNAAWC